MSAQAYGDLLIVGEPEADVRRALEVIAETLHAAYDRHPRIMRGKSKSSCVLCSLTVRDFLARIGFGDAEVREVAVYMVAFEGDKMLHSLGIGFADRPGADPAPPGYWSGHLVATAGGWLIDTTLYPAKRPQWPDFFGMVAVPLNHAALDRRIFDRRTLAQLEIAMPGAGAIYQAAWLDDRTNTRWRKGGDARDSARRAPVLRAMLDAWEQETQCASSSTARQR